METVMILCDFAESINGKLYIMGGGWQRVQGSNPIDCAVAIQIKVPWTQTNQKHTINLDLLGDDGPYLGPDGKPVGMGGEFEVGRPPGATPGEALLNTIAVRFNGLPLPTGGYRFSFKVDGTEMADSSFRVIRPPEWRQPSVQPGA